MTDTAPIDTAATTSEAVPDVKAQADKLVAEGKKAIALKDWEVGVEKYAGALDLMRQLVGDFDPAMAPLLLSYGKALYELAFASQGVMGKEEVDKAATAAGGEEDDAPVASSSNFVFEGDAVEDGEDVEEDANAEAGPSTGAAAEQGEGAEAEGEGEGEAEGGDEPEDDYNAAWEVLDVARTIYAKVVEDKFGEEAKEEKLCLAECYLSLGDVSLETENFPQAVLDYTEALKLKSALLPPSSRALASVHYQLATVLEFTPSGRDSALKHVEAALKGFQARLAELSKGTDSSADELKKMTEKERENEKKDVEALIGDLEVKIEELKAAPQQGEEGVDPVSESIKHLLGGVGEGAFGPSSAGSSAFGAVTESAPVNDLTSMVKKKKKPAQPAPAPVATEVAAVDVKGKGVENGEKRKADEIVESDAKKAKID